MNLDVWRQAAADLTMRVGALESVVERQGDVIDRLVRLVSHSAAERAVRQEQRQKKIVSARRGAIRALAGFFQVGYIETRAAMIERVCCREMPTPPGAEKFVAALIKAYGPGGPSRETIRRSLSEFSLDCDNPIVAEE